MLFITSYFFSASCGNSNVLAYASPSSGVLGGIHCPREMGFDTFNRFDPVSNSLDVSRDCRIIFGALAVLNAYSRYRYSTLRQLLSLPFQIIMAKTAVGWKGSLIPSSYSLMTQTIVLGLLFGVSQLLFVEGVYRTTVTNAAVSVTIFFCGCFTKVKRIMCSVYSGLLIRAKHLRLS